MSVLVFPVRFECIEGKLGEHADEISCAGRLYYPHWLARLRVSFRFPLVGERSRVSLAVVDGVTGAVQLLAEDIPFDEFSSMREHSSQCVPFVVHRRAIDEERVRRTALAHMSRSFRNWTNISVDLVDCSPLFKEMRVYRVQFSGQAQRTFALDTLTGEYGVLSAEASGLLTD